MSINKYANEVQGLSAEALAEQAERVEAIKAETAWRKKNQAKIDAGIVARAEAKDEGSKRWMEELRKEIIGELRRAESLRKTVAESAPKKTAEQADFKPDSRPVPPAAQAQQGGPQGTSQQAGISPQNIGGRP
ncbi:MAG: hypothetical protein Q4F67_10965 [Propionibacteriaceae bacterium]|nr:hypothetical protein [Propionibacteriaceae bacterium]